MDQLDAVLSATATLAQNLLSELSAIDSPMPGLITAPAKAIRLGRRRHDNDQPSSDDDDDHNGADTDLDLLVFAHLQTRRRRLQLAQAHAHNGGNSDDSSSMSDPAMLYPKVSLHEPEVVINGKRRAVVQQEDAVPPSSNGSPFMQYLTGCPDLTFETQFKLSRKTFSQLLKLLGPTLARNPSVVDANHALLITLWLLISSEDTICVAERFEVTRTSCQLTFASVCQAIAIHHSDFVRWIEPKQSRGLICAFDRTATITCPNVVGVIGCTRFKLILPNSVLYVQAICDAFAKFMHIEAYINTNDLSNTDVLAATAVPAQLGTPRMFVPTNCFPTSCHLVGDRSYPLGYRLMVPYKAADLTPTQYTYNMHLAKTTAIIDRAFARLRDRFVKLRGGSDDPVQGVLGNVQRFVETAMSVHNFCLLCSDSYYVDGTQKYEKENGQFGCYEDVAVPPDVVTKRDLLAQLMEQKALEQ